MTRLSLPIDRLRVKKLIRLQRNLNSHYQVFLSFTHLGRRMKPRPHMQTGRTSLTVSVIWVWIMVCGAVVIPENVEETTAAAEKSVRPSRSLSPGEQEYISQRKRIVLESLSSLGINCTEDSVPHIALLGSGGGERAAIGLIGSLYQMEKDGLLDPLLYLGGVSGSTWAMASLYSNPQWSVGMDRVMSTLLGPGVELGEAQAWLSKQAEDMENFSLTDIWAVMVSAAIMKQLDLRHLSEEAKRNATNPYPVYCALEKNCFSHGRTEGQWFELTPHEAGFTELGVFVQTSLLGSKFENGELQEEKPEMDMVKLQGLLGSALADEEMFADYIPSWLNAPGARNSAAAEYNHRYQSIQRLIGLTRNTVRHPDSLDELNNLQKLLEDTDKSHREEAARSAGRSSEDPTFFQQMSESLHSKMETWGQGLQEGLFKVQVMYLIQQFLPLVVNWEWGTTNNFLYQYQNSSVPHCLHRNESFHLVDAGFLVNVPFPSFLGDRRDIDLLIVPDYSAGEMFKSLTDARDYAAKVNHPFPEIDNKTIEEDRDFPKGCYVFEGKEKEPTIVFLPLFNRDNCKDAAEVKAQMEEFSTFQRGYSPEKIKSLLEIAKENMRNNKETLLREINKAVLRRRER
ncbi:cytosolic phospholipase A2 gamma-like [Cheilinus undulatus]|uniref:cytosolic phospholipase A2 gamma-like n=1 Tax=Cheilinus undulatus TaxID=241271 RepID=UPI001BD45974|nr:cytosolic phospholipase A2 gamma-like [Cheilinus undulatus]